MLIDILLLIVWLVVTYCVAGEGAWGATFVFLSVLFAGLFAMNFYEPIASLAESFGSGGLQSAARADFLTFAILFGGLTFLFRLACDRWAPTFLTVHPTAYHPLRWGMGLLTGYLTMAIVLTSLHLAPLPREFIGFTPERKNLFNAVAPDRQWLGFTQYVSEGSMFRGQPFDAPPTSRVGVVNSYSEVNDAWPSFPIRHADRRAKLDGPARAAAGGGGESKPKVIRKSGGGAEF